MMKNINDEVNKFLEEFKSAPELEKVRHAIVANKNIDLETIKEAQNLLNKWFRRRLYSLGRVVKHVEALTAKFDFDYKVGLGYSVEAKKDKINIDRYLMHLLLAIESKDREIAHLKSEVGQARETYLDMEDAISRFVNDRRIRKTMHDRFCKFYYLQR